MEEDTATNAIVTRESAITNAENVVTITLDGATEIITTTDRTIIGAMEIMETIGAIQVTSIAEAAIAEAKGAGTLA